MIRGMVRVLRFDGGDPDSPIAILKALCPACGFEHGFKVDLEGHGKWGPEGGPWSFDGNWDKPTFHPSMGANLHGQVKHHPICHSFVKNGQWQFLGDCTHDMAGQTVDMVPPDPDMSFERRAGWHLYPWTDDEGNPL